MLILDINVVKILTKINIVFKIMKEKILMDI